MVLLSAYNDGFKLVNCTYADLKHAFARAQESLQLQIRFVRYQLRHGGPSHDHLHRVRDLSGIKERGQWRTDGSVRRYEAHERLQQVEARLNSELRTAAQAAPAQIRAHLLLPFLRAALDESKPERRGRALQGDKASGLSGTTSRTTRVTPLGTWDGATKSWLEPFDSALTASRCSGPSAAGLRPAGTRPRASRGAKKMP